MRKEAYFNPNRMIGGAIKKPWIDVIAQSLEVILYVRSDLDYPIESIYLSQRMHDDKGPRLKPTDPTTPEAQY